MSAELSLAEVSIDSGEDEARTGGGRVDITHTVAGATVEVGVAPAGGEAVAHNCQQVLGVEVEGELFGSASGAEGGDGVVVGGVAIGAEGVGKDLVGGVGEEVGERHFALAGEAVDEDGVVHVELVDIVANVAGIGDGEGGRVGGDVANRNAVGASAGGTLFHHDAVNIDIVAAKTDGDDAVGHVGEGNGVGLPGIGAAWGASLCQTEGAGVGRVGHDAYLDHVVLI